MKCTCWKNLAFVFIPKVKERITCFISCWRQVKEQFWSGLADTDNESFRYVGYTETDMIEGKTDSERFQETLDSLVLLGIQGDKLKNLMQAICCIAIGQFDIPSR